MAVWQEAVTLDPGDDPALRSFHDEAVRSLETFDRPPPGHGGGDRPVAGTHRSPGESAGANKLRLVWIMQVLKIS